MRARSCRECSTCRSIRNGNRRTRNSRCARAICWRLWHRRSKRSAAGERQMAMDALLADLRYAFRLFRKSPGFSVIAILTLALGIGANTAIFSTVDAVLIRPLPYADPDPLVMVWEDASRAGFPRNTPAPANYFDWTRLNRSFSGMAATGGVSAHIPRDADAEQTLRRRVTTKL